VSSGTLEQLDTHLNPHQDNCQYVDTKCLLNCQQTIPKNRLEEHVTQECPKREFVCQHCAFKATYEEVIERHLPECRYVAVSCPNLCGVTCDREDMEDHMRICRLEEVQCLFCDVGCEEKLPREQEEKHVEENVSCHLALTARNCVKTNEDLQKKMQEQEMKLSSMNDKLQDQDQKIRALELENKSLKQEVMDQIRIQERNFAQLFDHFSSLEQLRSFKITNFSFYMQKAQLWKSTVMYTHGGYKFFISLKKNSIFSIVPGTHYSFSAMVAAAVGGSSAAVGGSVGVGSSAAVKSSAAVRSSAAVGGSVGVGSSSLSTLNSLHNLEIYATAVQGEYDESLDWPVSVYITAEIASLQSDRSMDYTFSVCWKKPKSSYEELHDVPHGYRLSSFSKLKEFIHNDTLFLRITNMELKKK